MKCKFKKICKLYRKDSVTCNNTGGIYHNGYAGCYRELEKQKNNK